MNSLRLLLIKGLGCLPLAWVRGLGSFIGWLSWLLQTRLATTTATNLAICYPQLSPLEIRALAKQSLMETSKTALEACLVWQRPWAWLKAKILWIEGEVLLKRHLAEGRGLLVLAPHLGNWEVLGPYLSHLGQFSVMYQPLKNQQINELVIASRSRYQSRLAPTNRKGTIMLVKALEAGEIVGILPDQVPEINTGSEFAPFFNHPARTMTLVHGLIQRTGCAACFAFAQRVQGGFKLVIRDAAEEIYSIDILTSVTSMNMSIEQCVTLAPAQYQWEYKRFRRLPEPYINPYRK